MSGGAAARSLCSPGSATTSKRHGWAWQASAVRSTKGHRDSGASAASESEVAEDIQVGGPSVGAATEEEESVEEEIMAEGGSPEAPGGPSAFPPAAPQVPDPEASKVSVSTDIEYAEEAHFSEAAASGLPPSDGFPATRTSPTARCGDVKAPRR